MDDEEVKIESEVKAAKGKRGKKAAAAVDAAADDEQPQDAGDTKRKGN